MGGHRGTGGRARKRLFWCVFTLAAIVALTLPVSAYASGVAYVPSLRWPTFGTQGYSPLDLPTGIAVGPGGNIFLVDSKDGRVQKYDNRGRYKITIGQADDGGKLGVTWNDVDRITARGVFVDPSGNTYVADTANHRVCMYDTSGAFVRSFGSSDPESPAYIDYAFGVTVDAQSRVYVADYDLSRILVFDPMADPILQPDYLVGSFGTSDLIAPAGIAFDAAGHLWVADPWNTLNAPDGLYGVVFRFTINDTNPHAITGSVTSQLDDSQPGHPEFMAPYDVKVGPDGTLLVSDTYYDRVLSIDPVTHAQAYNTIQGSGDWRLTHPMAAAVDSSGSVYVSDMYDDRVVKFVNQYITDSDPPVTTSNIPLGWTMGPFPVALTATDAQSGASFIMYGIDSVTANTTYTCPPPPAPDVVQFTISKEGTSSICYQSVDAKGNVEDLQTVPLRIDNHPPATVSDAPSGWVTSTVSVSFVASDVLSGVAGTAFEVDGSDPTTFTDPVPMPADAVSNLVFWSVDNAGNREDTRTATVRIDTLPPVTSCDAASSTYRSSATIHMTADDNLSGVASTFYSLDDTTVAVPYTGPFTVTKEGTTLLRFYSVDNAGNVEAQQTRVVNVDGAPPITTSDIDSAWHNSNVAVTLTATDTFGVGNTYYRVGAGAPTTYTGPFLVTNEGYNSVSFWSVDLQDNVETTHTATVKIDKTPPTSSDNTDGNWRRAAFSVYLSSSDALSGLAGMHYLVDGGGAQAYTAPFDVLGDGVHTVEYWGTDAAGNDEVPHRIATVRIDGDPPVTSSDATITSPLVHLNAVDDWTGVANTYYSIDGSFPTQLYNPATGFTIPQIGVVTLKFYSTDTIGNIEQVRTQLIVFDSVAPVTTSNIDAAWHGSPFMVVLNAMDGNSGVAHTYYQLNGGPTQTYSAPFPLTTEGSTTVTFWSVDIASNVETPTTQVAWVDATPPTTYSSADGDSSWHATTQTVTLNATDTITGVKNSFYRINGGAVTTYTAPFAVSANGTDTVEYFSKDVAGNKESTHTVLVHVDTAPPTTNSNIDQFAWRTFTVVLSAYDEESGVAHTYYRVNAGATTTYTSSFIVNSSGGTVVTFWSVDALGNVETARQATVLIDNLPPVTTCSATSAWRTVTQTVTLSASDSQSPIDTTFYRLNGGTVQSYSSPFVISAEGTTTLDYWSMDMVGNVEATKTVQVRIDRGAPQTTSNADSSWHLTPFTLSLSTSETVSGLKGMYYKIGGGAVTTYAAPVAMPEGSNNVSYWAVDYAGNSETTHVVAVKVDTQAPITTSNAQAEYFTTPTVSLTPTDPASGLAYTRWRVDGSSWTSGTSVPVSSLGTHTVDFYSGDNAGNVESIHTVTLAFRHRYEEIDTKLAFTGSDWTSVPGASFSGGYMRYATQTVDAVAWRFTGTETYWVALTGSQYGIGRVYLDGSAVATVDLYSPAYVYKSRVWSATGLANGTHTVVVTCTGSKNNSATANRLDIDAADALGSLVQMSDSQPPTTSSSMDGAWHATTQTVTLSATDADTAVRTTYYKIGNGAVTTYTAPFLVSAEGTTQVSYSSIDLFGNRETTKTANVRIDRTRPVTTDNAPAGWVTSAPSVSLTASDALSGVQGTFYSLNGAASLPYSTPVAVSADGTDTLQYWSVDSVGNTESTKTAVVRLDTVAPVTTCDAPLEWVHGPVAVHLLPSDGTSGISQTVYSLDGGPSTTYASQITVSGDGIHTIDYRSTDVAGNKEATHTASVRLDGTTPVTNDNAPASWVSGPVDVSLTVQNPLSPTTTFYTVNGGGQLTYSAPITISAEGTTTVRYWSVDAAGNAEATKTATVREDRTTPNTTDNAPTGWSTTDPAVQLSPADTVSGVALTRYSLDGAAAATYTAPFTVTKEGTTTLTYASVDVKGNVEPTRTATVRVDTGAPVTGNDAPGGWVSGPVDVTLTPNDAVSGPLTTQYSLNGGAPAVYAGPIHLSAEGTTTIAYCSLDVAGNAEATKTVTVQQDRTAPNTGDNAPTGWVTSDPLITLTGFDAVSGVASTRYSLDGAAAVSYSAPFAITKEGVTTLAYYSTDVKGNAEATHTTLVHVDTIAPVTTDNAPTGWVSGPVDVTLTPNDGNSGIASTRYSVNGAAPVTYTAPIHISAEGTTTIAYCSADVAGNAEATKTATVCEDRTAPNTSDNAPTAWVTSDPTVALTGFDAVSGVASTRYSLDGAAAVSYSAPFAITKEGVTTLAYYSTDVKGNAEATHTTLVHVDTIAPVTTDNAPTGWVSGPVDVTLTPNDGNSGIASTRYSVNGAAPVTYTAPIHISAEGTTTIAYCSADVAGNAETTKTATVYEDRTAPNTTDNAPLGWSTVDPLITLSAFDAVSGVGSTRYSLDGSAAVTYSAPFAITKEGTTTLTYRSTDVKGNVEGTRTTTVKVDTIAPVTTNNALAEYTATATVTLSASDGGSGLVGTRYSFDGGAWTTGTVVTTAAPGNHTLLYRSSDVAGNVEGTKTVSFGIWKRYEESDPNISYIGAWGTLTNAGCSGGFAKYETANAGDAFVARFKGTGIDWRVFTGPAYGIAQVVVDGVPTATADLYSASYAYGAQKVLTLTGMADTTHTVCFLYTGTKDPSGTAARIDVDAIDVIGTLVPVVDTDPPVTLSSVSGSWVNATQTVTLTPTDASAIKATWYKVGAGSVTTYTAPFTVSAEGATTVSFWSKDIWGNTETTKTAQVRIDRGAPSTTNNAPGGWATSPFDVTLTCTDGESGPGQTFYALNGGMPQTYLLPVHVAADGTTTIAYWSVDAAGNVETTKSVTVRLDTHAPVTSDNTPAGWQEGAVSVTLTAADTISGVGATRYSLDGGPVTSYSMPVIVSGNGSHTLAYASTDLAGNAETTHAAQVLIDTSVPVSTDDAPKTWVPGPVDVSISASDAVSGVAATYCSVNGAAPTTYTGPIHISAEGTTTLAYWSVDAAGNAEATETATIREDRTAPVTTDDAPASWATAPVAVTLNASDPVSGVAFTRYTIDGGAALTYAGPFQISADGTHTVTYASTDVEGNTESTHTVVVRIDKAAPVTTDNAPASWVADPVDVSLTAADGISGLTGTFYAVNGGIPASYVAPIHVTAEGTTTITYWSTDAAGNAEATKTALVREDRTPPTSSDNVPGGWWTAGANLTLTGNDAVSGIAGIRYTINGGASATYTAPVTMPEGTSTVTYAAVDNEGNAEATHTVTAHVDTQAPLTTSNTQPEYVGTATVTLTPSDAISGVSYTKLSLDGGAWTTGTVSATSTVGAHTLQFYSVDKAGNVEPTRSVSYGMRHRYEQTDPNIVYRGNWASLGGGSSGGSSYYDTANAGDAFVFKFSGTSFNWIAYKYNTYGIAKVTIDGVATTTVDLYSSSLIYQQNVLSVGGLVNGPHIVTVSYTGSMDASGTGARIDVDALDIIGTMMPVDDVAPPTTTSTIDASWHNATQTVTLSATDGGSGVRNSYYKVNGGATTTYTVPFQVGASGVTTVTYWSVDALGNTESQNTALVRIDRVAPVTTDNAPGGWQNAPVSLSLTSNDASSGVSQTFYRVNGGAPQTYILPVQVALDGTTTINYWSVDTAGNAETTKTCTVKLDTTAPSTTDNIPAATWHSSPTTVTLTAADLTSGMSATYYSVDGAAAATYTVPFGVSGDGAHTVAYRSRDVAGNYEATHTVTLQVDASAPSASDDATGWVRGSATLHLFANDALSGLGGIYYSTNGSAAVTPYAGGIPIANEGTTAVKYVALDNVGNQSATRTANVLLDNTAPITSSDVTATYPDNATVTLSPVDPESGVSYTRSRVDTSAWTTGTVAAASTLGTHTVQWYSVDKVGNVETTKSATFTIVPGITRYEDDNAKMAYQGSWTPATNPQFSNGELKVSDVTGSCVDMAFTGTEVHLYALKSAQYGKARITLDTSTTAMVDLSAPGSELDYQTDVWSAAGLTPGAHTLRMEWTGQTGASGTGTKIDLDAVGVRGGVLTTATAGPPPTTRYEQDNALVTYQQGWTRAPATGQSSSYSGGSLLYSNVTSAAVNTAFSGTRVSLVALTGPNYGKAKVTIDGTTTPAMVDLYSASYLYKQVVWTSPALADGPHTVRIEWTGSKNASATATQIDIDALDVVGTMTTRRYEEIDPLINFQQLWSKTTTSSSYSGGTLKYSTAATAAANITFTGDQISLVALTGPNYGIAKVQVDTSTPSFVDLYSAAYQYKQTVWTKTGLPDTQHTLRVEWTGSKNASSTLNQIDFDAVDVSGILINRRYEETDPMLSYQQTWNSFSGANYSGGTLLSTNATGAAANFAFSGTQVSLAALTDSNYGIARVQIDTQTPVNVDLYSPSHVYNKIVWTSGQLPDGPHTVTVQWTGTKNGSSSGTQIDVDALDVVGILTVRRFEDPDANLVYMPAWTPGAGANYSAGNVHYTNATSATVNVAFSGKRIDWYALTGSNYGTASVSLDGGAPQLVNLFSASYLYQRLAWTSGTIADGPHTLRIERVGTSNIDVDAFDVLGVLTPANTPQRFEQTDPRIAYSSAWTTAAISGASGGSLLYSETTGSVATVKFTGTSITAYGLQGPFYGIASIALDGGTPQLVSLYNANYAYQYPMFSASSLPNTTHTLTITVTGSADASATGVRVPLDAVDVVGDLTQAP